MIKLIVIFASLNVLNIYCELNCGGFKDNTCGGLTSFKSKCHQFNSGCEEIQVDDGCKFDETHNCVEEKSLGTNEKCYRYSYSSNNCRRIKHQCTSYIDDNCGELAGINNLKQCTKLLNNDFCVEIDIDDSCQIKKVGDSYICTANGDVENDFNENYVCELDKENKSCKKQKKVCSKYTSNCNSIAASTGKTCSKVKDETNCKEVTIDPTCQIDSDGDCIDGTGQTDNNKICDFNSGKTTCAPRAKTTCEEYSSSSTDCSTITVNGKKCYKVYGVANCKEMTIDNQCTIDEEGNCELKDNNIPSGSCIPDLDNRRCKFTPCTEYNSKSPCNQVKGCVFLGSCKEFTVGENCQVSNGVCLDTDSPADSEKTKCLFDNEKPECKKREKKCEDYSTAACNDLTYPNSKKKCVYDGSSDCYEVELDNYCTVNSGNCVEKEDSGLSDTEICDFISKTECKKRKRICEELLSEDICNNYSPINNQFCFKYEDGDDISCDVITVEDGCQINSSNKCVAKRKQDSCTLDKDNKRCYKSKSGASLLSLKIFSLLFLFLIC